MPNAGEFDGLPNDIAVDQKILPKKALWRMAKLGQQFARGARRQRHGSTCRATFIHFIVIEKREQISAVSEAATRLVLFESGRGIVAPPAFRREAVPYHHV